MATFTKIIVATSVLFLTACSSEPSEQQLREVYQQSIDETNQIAVKIGGDPMKITLQDFEKLSCTESDEKTDRRIDSTDRYQCKIKVKLKLPIVGVTDQAGEMTVAKQGKGWVASQP